jgi:hypothetical protein
MPLQEVWPNVRSSIDINRERNGRNGATAKIAPPPIAVQSMLKTTTELGDLGMFGTGLAGLPRSSSRLHLSRARSGSLDTPFKARSEHHRSLHPRRHGKPHGPRPVPSSSNLFSCHTSRSNLSSYAPSRHPRRRQNGHRSNHVHGLASPSPSLYTHRSLATLRSARDTYSVRSESPFGPRGTPRGPPYRVSSPAYTDGRGPPLRYPGFGRAPSINTVTSSPSSNYGLRVPAPGYGSYSNGSYTSLHRIPSPSVPDVSRPPYARPPSSNRSRTPIMYGPHHIAPVESSTSLAHLPHSPTGSTTPAYYDYSESFVEETCFSPDGAEDRPGRPPLTMDQTIRDSIIVEPLRHAQTPFGTRAGSSFHPIEMPTKHNRRESEISRHSARLGSRQSAKRLMTGLHKSPRGEEAPHGLQPPKIPVSSFIGPRSLQRKS